MYAAEWNVEWR